MESLAITKTPLITGLADGGSISGVCGNLLVTPPNTATSVVNYVAVTEKFDAIDAQLTQLGTNLNTQMEAYVQSVALTGADPTLIGSANQVVAINATGNGFAGVSNSELFDRLKSDIKKAILIYGD